MSDQDSPQERFERHFKGTWRKRWWMFLSLKPPLMQITTYRTGEITGEIVAVCGHDDDGTRIEVALRPDATRIGGYIREADEKEGRDG